MSDSTATPFQPEPLPNMLSRTFGLGFEAGQREAAAEVEQLRAEITRLRAALARVALLRSDAQAAHEAQEAAGE
jgi:hypothetical protein